MRTRFGNLSERYGNDAFPIVLPLTAYCPTRCFRLPASGFYVSLDPVSRPVSVCYVSPRRITELE